MKMRKIWIVGLIVLLLAAGFVFTGCAKCERDCNMRGSGSTVTSQKSCGHSDCIVEQAIQRGSYGMSTTAWCGC